jgi:2-oxoglutarate dehydrogenase E1 component
MIEAPIFHVNGDDPWRLNLLAIWRFDFRQRFGRDVVIDMYCYRRYGHNEGDEPSFTQPDLYAKIEKRPSVTQLYRRELLEAGTLSEDDAASLETEFGLRLEMTRDEVDAIEKRKASEKARFRESTAIFQPEYSSESEPTAISEKTLKTIVDGLTRVPEGFEVQPKIKRIVLDHQRKVFEEGGPYEWHYAEALAFGSLLLDGIPIRLSGQDSSRGTFSTRHSVLYDAKTGKPYVPLMHLAEKTSAHLHLQQSTLGGCGARVRLRILARLSEDALFVGSAVRRFLQWRADHYRSIHRFSGIEMAAA